MAEVEVKPPSSGRLAAVLAKRNRELYEEVKELARQQGKKVSEILEEALEIWRMSQFLQDVDPKSFTAALWFIEHMLYQSVNILVNLSRVFTSAYFQSNLTLVKELNRALMNAQQEMQQMQQQVQKGKGQGKGQSEVASAIREQMRLMMMQMMLPTLMQVMQQLTAAVGGGKAPATPMPMPMMPMTGLTGSKLPKPKVEE